MTVHRGFLIFAALTASWAQTLPAAKKGAPAKRPATSTASKKPAAKPAATPPARIGDEAAFKILKAVAAKYKAMDSYELEGSIDSGRQVAEEARQAMSKADVKFRSAPGGKYVLEVIEEDDAKRPYKVVSDGTQKWTFVSETNQYKGTPASTSKPVSAAEPSAGEPLATDEAFSERLVRQLVPLLANIDKTTETAFARGRIITALSKKDAEGHSFLMYLTLDNEDGTVSKVSWYQSSGPETERMLLRTDYVLTTLKSVPAAGPANEFSFTPPQGAVEYKQPPTTAASSEYHKP